MVNRTRDVVGHVIFMVVWSFICYYALLLNLYTYKVCSWLGSTDLAPIALGTTIATWVLWVAIMGLTVIHGMYVSN